MVLCLVDLGYVHTKADSFCAAMKIIAERACAHSQERLWWRDICDGAKLRSADLESRGHILDSWFCAILWYSVNTYSAHHRSK